MKGFRSYLPNTFFNLMKKSSTFLCEMDYSIFKLSFFTYLSDRHQQSISLTHRLSSIECLYMKEQKSVVNNQ